MRYTPTATASNTPTPSITASQTPSYTPTGTVCPGLTPTATPTISVTPSQTSTLPATPTSTATPTKTPFLTPSQTPSNTPPPCGTGQWTVFNYDCGFGTLNDVGINGCFMNTLDGPSTFPLTSTLYGTKASPNCVVDGSNSIQINLTTNIAGVGNCLVVVVYKNGVLFHTQYYNSNGPAISVGPLDLRICDDIEIGIECYPTGCP